MLLWSSSMKCDLDFLQGILLYKRLSMKIDLLFALTARWLGTASLIVKLSLRISLLSSQPPPPWISHKWVIQQCPHIPIQQAPLIIQRLFRLICLSLFTHRKYVLVANHVPILHNSSDLKETGNTEFGDPIEEGFVQVKIKHQKNGKKVQLIKTTRTEDMHADVQRGRNHKAVTRVREASFRPNLWSLPLGTSEALICLWSIMLTSWLCWKLSWIRSTEEIMRRKFGDWHFIHNFTSHNVGRILIL